MKSPGNPERFSLSVDFSSLGSYINFWVDFTDNVDTSIFPSQFSVFYTSAEYFPILSTNDPYGVNSVFTITTRAGCEELTVYSPAVFVAPDYIYVDLAGIPAVGPQPENVYL